MVSRRDLETSDWVLFHNRVYRENTKLVDDALTHIAEELRFTERGALPRDDG